MGPRWRETRTPGRVEAVTWPSRLWAIPVFGFAALWWNGLLRWYGLLFFAHGGPRAMFMLFGLPFVAAGVVLLWLGLRLLLNRIRLSIDGERLRIDEQPLPVGHLEVATAEIDAVAVEAVGGPDEDGPRGFRVVLRLSGDRALPLPLQTRTRGDAQTLATHIERALDHAPTPLTYRG
jgi:hypothetical protein